MCWCGDAGWRAVAALGRPDRGLRMRETWWRCFASGIAVWRADREMMEVDMSVLLRREVEKMRCEGLIEIKEADSLLKARPRYAREVLEEISRGVINVCFVSKNLSFRSVGLSISARLKVDTISREMTQLMRHFSTQLIYTTRAALKRKLATFGPPAPVVHVWDHISAGIAKDRTCRSHRQADPRFT